MAKFCQPDPLNEVGASMVCLSVGMGKGMALRFSVGCHCEPVADCDQLFHLLDNILAFIMCPDPDSDEVFTVFRHRQVLLRDL